jgi:hypothetical protein
MGLPGMVLSTITTDTATYVNLVPVGDLDYAGAETYDHDRREEDFEVDQILMNLASEKIKDAGEASH